MQKKADTLIRSGTIITGKWQGKSYTIIRSIGSGMVGTVYLCRHQGKLYALKMGNNPTALVREVTILKNFNKARNQLLGPFLFDVDDWNSGGRQTVSFYVMEYIHGIQIESYVKKHGPKTMNNLLLQMLKYLERLHKMGYVYGDLKNENLLVTNQGSPTIRFIDVGGVTKIRQSVKEYSAFFDRGYWQLGTRRAEPSYDLFALVMVFMSIYYPKQFRRGRNPQQQLIKTLQDTPELRVYTPSFRKALNGDYSSAKAMQRDVEMMISRQQTVQKRDEEPILSQAIILLVFSLVCFVFVFFI